MSTTKQNCLPFSRTLIHLRFFCRIRVAYYISFAYCYGVFWYGLGSSGVDIKKKEKWKNNDLQNNIRKTTDWAMWTPPNKNQRRTNNVIPVDKNQRRTNNVIPVNKNQRRTNNVIPVDKNQRRTNNVILVDKNQRRTNNVIPVNKNQRRTNNVIPVEQFYNNTNTKHGQHQLILNGNRIGGVMVIMLV